MTQLGLFPPERDWLRDENVRELEKAFWEFHDANPDIYRHFKRYTFKAIRSGRERLGARMIWDATRESRNQNEPL